MRAIRLAPLVFLALTGCATPAPVVGRTAGGAEIAQIELSLSNVFLLKSKTPILVDAGSEGDLEDLEEALAEHGLAPKDIRLVIVTHGHVDHAGQAAELRKLSGAKVALGAGDRPLAKEGRNDDLTPMYFMARLIRPFVADSYPAFEPDLVVGETPLDLAPWGVEGKAMAMPGHTEGSVVVLLPKEKAAFVGDQILGGSWGGALCPTSPSPHYFHADEARNRRNIAELVKLGVETFYLGHGGPVARADVIEEFEIE